MSRWKWHEKIGPRRGPIKRKADYLSAENEESQERSRLARERDWIEHHPPEEPMFKPTRVCDYCGTEQIQNGMRWSGRRWLCPRCYDDARGTGAFET